MEREKKFEHTQVEKILSENYLKLMPSFYEMQSSFLTGIYKRYGDLEGGNIVIFFARDCHLEIIRKRENHLDFDLSLDNFWANHKKINQTRKKIILVSEKTGLPKETTRRKILVLIKRKHIKKNERNYLYWEPETEHKETYIKIIEQQIHSLSKFVFELSKSLNLSISLSKIEKEIKKNYSFYWYHYLSVQLEYIKFWHLRFKDLEMLLIGLQTVIQTINFLKRSNIESSFSNFISKLPKNMNNNYANISATSISEITGIPRATCIRKLDKFIKMKILEKDKNSKRYSINFENKNSNPMIASDEIWHKIFKTFSRFSYTVLSGLNR